MKTATPPAKHAEVGQAYRVARRRKGISQERLAEEAGISRRHMIRLENGEHRPMPELRDRIASVLGADPASLPACEAVGRPFAAKTSESGS